MPAEVRVEHFSYKYPLAADWAFTDVNMHIQAGERVLITGRSGWGKSTLLQAIAGVLSASDDGGQMRGNITIDDIPSDQVRGRVGLIFQDPDTQVIFARVADNVTFAGENLGIEKAEILSRSQAARQLMRIDEAHGVGHASLAQHLSGGQTQRLAIASVIAMQPDVIICDEPTANVDPDGVPEVVQAISDAAESTGATLIVVDHNIKAWHGVVTRTVHCGDSTDTKMIDCSPRRGTGECVLSVENLAAGYEGKAISQGLTTQFHRGEITAITGKNGAGKTTIAQTLAGLLPAISGKMLFDGKPLRDEGNELAHHIQFVFQNPEHQFVTNKVIDEMITALTLTMRGERSKEKLTDAAMKRLDFYGLADLAEHNPFTLSGGQKRRLTVACALEIKPEVLILDEPTYGQDPVTWRAVIEMFARVRDEGTCIIAVTHDRDFIQALGARELNVDQFTQPYEVDKKLPSQSVTVEKLNPVTRLGTGILVGLPLIASLDIISAGFAVIAEFVIALILGFHMKKLTQYTWPILLGAAGGFATVAIYNEQHDMLLAAATSLRVIAMSAPAVILVMRLDPTDLADAFVQRMKLPDTFVYAALAGTRLLPLLRVDMESIHQAQRMRGNSTKNLVIRFAKDALSVLVLAIRRASTLSTVMQARGFGANVQRTYVRESRMTYRDAAAFIVALVVPACALVLAYYGGTFNLFGNLV